MCCILITSTAAFTPHISVGSFCSTVFMVHMFGCAVTVFLFNFYCVYVYLTWMNVFAPLVCCAPGSQKMVLDLLGLDLQLFVLYPVGAWNPTHHKEEQLVLLRAEPPLQLRVTTVCLPCQNKERKLRGSII